MTAHHLRTAAAKLREEGGARNFVIGDWLDDEAIDWERTFAIVQTPSPGVDDPPAIHYGDPKAAARCADHHARHALAVANAVLADRDVAV